MSDARDALKKSAAAVRTAASKAANELGNAAEKAATKAGDAADLAGDAALPILAKATEHLNDVTKDPQSVEELLYLVESAASELRTAAAEYARREPIKSLFWATVFGAVAMALVQVATAPRHRHHER